MDDERLNKLIDDFYLITLLFRKSLLQYKRILKHKKIVPSNYRVLGIEKTRSHPRVRNWEESMYIKI